MVEEHDLLNLLLNLHDFEARARTVMRKSIFDMVDGGFNDEITYKRTRPAFDSIGLIPRYLKDVSHVDTSTELLGQRISLPVLPAPSAPQIGAHPDGDLATCRAAGAVGTIEIVSHGSDFTIEEVSAAAGGPVWCNIFMLKNRDYMRQYVRRGRSRRLYGPVLDHRHAKPGHAEGTDAAQSRPAAGDPRPLGQSGPHRARRQPDQAGLHAADRPRPRAGTTWTGCAPSPPCRLSSRACCGRTTRSCASGTGRAGLSCPTTGRGWWTG